MGNLVVIKVILHKVDHQEPTDQTWVDLLNKDTHHKEWVDLQEHMDQTWVDLLLVLMDQTWVDLLVLMDLVDLHKDTVDLHNKDMVDLHSKDTVDLHNKDTHHKEDLHKEEVAVCTASKVPHE